VAPPGGGSNRAWPGRPWTIETRGSPVRGRSGGSSGGAISDRTSSETRSRRAGQNLAPALLIYRLRPSALLLGVLTLPQSIPCRVRTPWAGSLADGLDRRKLLLVSQRLAVVLAAG